MAIVAHPDFNDPAESNGRRPPTGGAGEPKQGVTSTRRAADTYFAPLTGTAQEAQALKALFPDAVLLMDTHASETAVRSLRSPKILHIATHGFFRSENEGTGSISTAPKQSSLATTNPLLQSGLAFSGANNRGGSAENDGIVTALEATGLDLWGTKLVVLSACDTGVGAIRNGEGVYGLRRSFRLAGAESLVMSLWPVSDLITRELMVAYYRNLKNGMGRGDALRKVQLEMIKNPKRSHPFYWASFIQTGEWANLEGSR
jgi:CHAT domain-containing protein